MERIPSHSLDKRAEPEEGRGLIGFVGGKELEHRRAFGINAETRHGLSAIGVESPDRLSREVGEARKEIGERLGRVVPFYRKAFAVQGVFWDFMHPDRMEERIPILPGTGRPSFPFALAGLGAGTGFRRPPRKGC